MSVLHQISGCGNPNRQADVLFLHGLGGDAFATWRFGKDESTSWPHWLGNEFPGVGVWSRGYAASPTKWMRLLRWLSRDAGHAMALPDRAQQVLRTASDAVTDPKKRALFDSTRAVLFLATPHAGAELASLLNAFRTLFGATISVEDLRLHDAHLQNLYDWYVNHATVARIETATYFETRRVEGVVPIVAGQTGLDPGWYSPARQVFNEFPSEESLLLLRAWGIDSVLDARAGDEPSWPEGVLLRGRRSAPGSEGACSTCSPGAIGTVSVRSLHPMPGRGRGRPRPGTGPYPRWSSTTTAAASAVSPRAFASSASSGTSGSTSRRSPPAPTSAHAPRISC